MKLPKEIEITVGIHAAEGASSHDGDTLAGVAEQHEFGLGVPQRSFIRRWADEDIVEINQILERELSAIVEGTPATVAAERAALILQGKAQRFISDGRATPANSPGTIAKKGSSTPLIDTGRLRQGILGKSEVK